MVALRDRIRDDSGAVAVIVALTIVIFAMLATLVVDVGYWYNVRRQLQAAADASALAGCHELIRGGTDTEIWGTVTEYVVHNTVIPADTTITVIPPSAGGFSDIGDDFVKVTVERDTRSFFAGIFGVSQAPIRAQARAQVAYANEGRGLVPFSVPIILPGPETDVIVRVGGQEENLDPYGDDGYDGDISFNLTPAADEAHSLPVYVEVYNSQGVMAENFSSSSGAARAIARALVIGDDFPIRDVWWDDVWVVPGTTSYLYIRMADDTIPEPDVSLSGPGVNVNSAGVSDLGGGLWRVGMTVPSDVVDRYAIYEAEVSVKVGKDKFEFEGKEPAALLIARRSNAPIQEVDASPIVFTTGGSHTIDLFVEFTRFRTLESGGPRYALKLDTGGGAESGNFGLVDFRHVYIPPYPPFDAEREYDSSLLSNWYKDSIVQGWPGDIRIGDAMYTYTGNVASTVGPLDERFGDNDMTASEWLAANKPASPRLLYVPVIERWEDPSGRTIVVVVEFGGFYVENFVKSDALLEGYFVEYVGASGGSTGNPGPTGLGLKTPHLVSEDIDF